MPRYKRKKAKFPHPSLPTPSAEASDVTNFATMQEFISVARENPAHNIDWSTEWAGVATLAEACNLAETGWPIGTSKIVKLAASITDKVTSLIEVPQVYYDVTGLDFDMGMHLSGVPESWFDYRYEHQDGHGFKHVHVVYNFAVSAGISVDIIEARGAITAALVLSLETAGVRVTLDAVCAVAEGSKELWVRIKDADQPLDMDRLAFALVHPAMLRHLLLAAKAWGYDPPGDVQVTHQGDIYIGKGHLQEEQWMQTDRAQEWILTQLKNQGVHVTTEVER